MRLKKTTKAPTRTGGGSKLSISKALESETRKAKKLQGRVAALEAENKRLSTLCDERGATNESLASNLSHAKAALDEANKDLASVRRAQIAPAACTPVGAVPPPNTVTPTEPPVAPEPVAANPFGS